MINFEGRVAAGFREGRGRGLVCVREDFYLLSHNCSLINISKSPYRSLYLSASEQGLLQLR